MLWSIFPSAKKVMFLLMFICLPVCMLLADSRQKQIFNEICYMYYVNLKYRSQP